MPFDTKAACAALVAIIALSSTAQAQPQSGTSTMGSMSGSQMQNMPGMQGNSMSGMNMQAMMAHCSKMQEEIAQNRPMSPDMRKMMGECQRMDSQMKPAQAPAATLSR